MALAALLVGAVGLRAPRAGAEPVTPTLEVASMEQEWNAWHAERLARLTGEDGWLTLIDLAFLGQGKATLGRAEGADLRYAHLSDDEAGTFIRSGDQVRFEPAPGAAITADGAPAQPMTLVADDQGPPTVLRSGSVSIVLVRRNGDLALRVRDNASPVRTGFRGVDRYPIDPSRRVNARVERAPKGTTVAVTNVTGYTSQEPLDVTLVFEIDGRERRLVARESSPGNLFIVFGDKTNGAGTHGGGRFLEASIGGDGEAILDFNRAYNPPCSFTAFATCELPTAGNRLPVAIEAGERAPKGPEVQ
ncbi:MAG: DUF1684 domain-containing protein [Phycisphaerales bacterium]|nr:DUF1684 domain-containing protein [Phycisphaerales bacterium]